MNLILIPLLLFFFNTESDKTDNKKPVLNDNLNKDITLISENKVKPYDSFHKITQNFLSSRLTNSIYEKSKEVYHLRRIRVDHTYRIFNKNDTFYKFEYEIDSKGFYQAKYENDSLYINIVLYEFERDTVFTSVNVNEMLIASLNELGVNDLLAIELSNIFAWDVDFTFDIKRNDRFNIFYEKKYLDNEFKGVGNIIAANYIQKEDTMFIYRRDKNEAVDYFNNEGQNVKKAFLKAPVNFSRISSGFSYRRFHPIQKKYKPHFGTDYVADKNTPVYAIADGTVMYKGFKKYNGNYIHLRHKGGFESKYLHFNRIAPNIKKYGKVKQGQVIGYIGKTGLATGYHVCFRFYLNGYPFNFKKVKNPIVSRLNDNDINDFKSNISKFKYTF